jgi:hypothetical protein
MNCYFGHGECRNPNVRNISRRYSVAADFSGLRANVWKLELAPFQNEGRIDRGGTMTMLSGRNAASADSSLVTMTLLA